MKKCFALGLACAWILTPMAARAEDIYVSPYDANSSSDESSWEQAGSGFDTAGPFAIPADDYNQGVSRDGSTYTPQVPNASPLALAD